MDGPFNAADYRRLHASAAADALREAEARASADAAYTAQSQAEAYARALDLEAQSRVDTASSVPLPPDADMLPPQTPPADAQAMPDPATVPAAGDYPPDRPSSALYAFNAAAVSALAAPDRSRAAAPSADADALRGPTETAEVLAAAMQRASRIYRRVSHVPTSLAPYGTGISQTV